MKTQPLLSLDELITIVHQYYPRGISWDDPAYRETPEYSRLVAAQLSRTRNPVWQEFIRALRERWPEASIQDWTIPYHDACYKIHFDQHVTRSLPQSNSGSWIAGGLISHIAPVYLIYSIHYPLRPSCAEPDPTYEPHTFYEPMGDAQYSACILAAEIERGFSYPALPLAWAETPMPEYHSDGLRLGEARLIDLLFTDHRW